MELDFHTFELVQRDPWTVSRESFSVTRALIVELRQDGVSGFGEASEFMPDHYDSHLDSMVAALRTVEPVLSRTECHDPVVLWDELAPVLSTNSFAQSALDVAAHDLWGRLQDRAVYELWGLDPSAAPPTDYSIGIDVIDVMVRKLTDRPNWPVYKVKVGLPNDIEVLRTLREHTTSPFRVDANCGWTLAEAREKVPLLPELGVELVEQPLPVDDWGAMQDLRSASTLQFFADESCCRLPDVERCDGHFDGVNIKLMKCGGLTPARRMVDRARSLGLSVMAGCMPESTVGISALAQLAPLLDYLDADSPLLITNDIARGVDIRSGRLVYPSRPGIGVELL